MAGSRLRAWAYAGKPGDLSVGLELVEMYWRDRALPELKGLARKERNRVVLAGCKKALREWPVWLAFVLCFAAGMGVQIHAMESAMEFWQSLLATQLACLPLYTPHG